MDVTLSDTRLRNQHLQRLAARLGDLYEDMERLPSNVHRCQPQIDHVPDYVTARQHWIGRAQREIDELAAQAEMVEARYYSLDGEGQELNTVVQRAHRELSCVPPSRSANTWGEPCMEQATQGARKRGPLPGYCGMRANPLLESPDISALV